jgi:hypothetical protein
MRLLRNAKWSDSEGSESSRQSNLAIMQPMLPLGLTGLDTLPSSKVRRPGSHAPFRWAYSYTGFSLDFAFAVLRALGAREGTTIFDPFLGSGTTLVAAASLGCAGYGIEINPFAALLARTRLSSRVDRDRIVTLLSRRTSSRCDQGGEVLGAENAAYASRVIRDLAELSHVQPADLWERIFSDPNAQHDSDAVVLLSLAMGARESARLVRGSNPVWLRAPGKNERTGEIDLRGSALNWAERICRDLDTVPPNDSVKYRIAVGDIAVADLPSGGFHFCLTSPPYLNRLDYVTASLPELTVLQLVKKFTLEELKKKTIGTTRVVSKAPHDAPTELGHLALNILQTIRKHPSYASERYYYHIYTDYFARLFAALKRMRSCMHPHGKGIIVLQDSFYKDMNVPTPNVCVEMLKSLSCEAEIVRTQPIRTHMGRMSPRQSTYVPRKVLSESLIYFSAA